MKIISNTNFSSQNRIEPRRESYIRTSKRYLENLINTIRSYAPLIAFWTTWLYTIPEIEGYAIIGEKYTPTTETFELEQVDIVRLPLIPSEGPCIPGAPFRATDIHLCRPNDSSCIIL